MQQPASSRQLPEKESQNQKQVPRETRDDNREEQVQYELCKFVLASGNACKCPAVTESDFCYHHQEHYRRRRKIHNTFLGKSKVLEPFMSGAAAGRDPVTKRVYDALFADAVDALDLPPFDPPGDPVAVALTNILHLVATQQVERSITQQMLYTVRLAMANRDKLAAHAEKAAVGSRPSAIGQNEAQEQEPFTTKDTESHRVASCQSEVLSSPEPSQTPCDSVDSVVQSFTHNREPLTDNDPQTPCVSVDSLVQGLPDDDDEDDEDDEPGVFDHLTPEEISELYDEALKHGTPSMVTLARINARRAAQGAPQSQNQDQKPATDHTDHADVSENGKPDAESSFTSSPQSHQGTEDDPVSDQNEFDPCESVESVTEGFAENQQPTTGNGRPPARGGYVHKTEAWYEKKALEAEEYQREDRANYISKALKVQDARDEREQRRRQQRDIMKGKFADAG